MSSFAIWRSTALLIVLALLTACGSGADAGANAAPSSSTEAKPTQSAPSSPAVAAASPAASPATAGSAAAAATGQMPWEMPGAGLVKAPLSDEAKQLTGAGATFPAPLYTRWFAEYARLTGVEVNYQSIGSGGGIKAITDNTTDFAASDGPMTDEQLAAAGGGILHIPMTLGAVVVTYNLPDVPAGATLKLTGETVAGIFLGEITKWNDARLAADNPGVPLPNKDIVVVHRSDGSGTSYIFTDFLSSVSPKWNSTVAKATSVNWPTGLGGKGNEGVSGEVKQNPYAIGYVELAYAIQNKLPYAQIKNKAGQFVEPTMESTTAAAAGVADRLAPDLRVSIVNPDGPIAYPIASFTWILARQEMADASKALALTRLLWWASHDGQKLAPDLDYAPLPPAVVARVEEKIRSIAVSGKPVFPDQ